ncbi:MAG: YhjD/YihY/BrkB family envelope integrity protein, partial [Eubacteriales bacterium]
MRIFRNKDSFPYRFLRLFIQSDVPAASAEMAYFLVFAFFPLLMVIHASLSMVIQGFDLEQTFFYSLLPNVIEELLDTYIEHISENSNISFLVLGIILTVYTLSKFMKSTKRT